jgi:membrane-associated phospholipid phosphatase
LTLSENARLLGLLNVAIADAAISCWNAKYTYVFWRPVTAIPLADTDGNPGTIADPNWTPLFATPAFPEYPSGHSCNSSAAATVLANYFGDNTAFILDSDVMLEVTRFFPSFSAAIEEVANARVFAGIHFRTACRDGVQLGSSVANYVLNHSFEPVHEGAPQRN